MQIYNSFFISQIKTPIFFSATEKYLRGRVVRLKIYCYFCCRNAGVPGLEAGAEMIPLTPDTDNADTGSCRFSRILHMLPMRGLRVKTRVPLSSYPLGKNIAYGQTTLPGRTVYSRFRPLRGRRHTGRHQNLRGFGRVCHDGPHGPSRHRTLWECGPSCRPARQC